MKKLLLVSLMLILVGCSKNDELRKYEQMTFDNLNETYLDVIPPDTYTYRHKKSEIIKIDGVRYAKIYIIMTVSTQRWTPNGFIPASQSWEQVYSYEIEKE